MTSTTAITATGTPSPDTAPIHQAMTATSWVWIGAAFALVIGFYILRRWLWNRIREKRSNFFTLMFQYLNAPVQVVLLLNAVFLTCQQFPVTTTIRDQVWFHKLYAIMMIVLTAWIAIRLVFLGCDLVTRRFNLTVPDNLHARRVYTQIGFVRRLAVAIFSILALASCLMVFDQIRSLGVSLMASAGVAGIVLGFAAQKTLGNLFSGLQIAIAQPIRIEDAVIVEGEFGVIEEINLTYVVVKLWDLRRMVLPISYFIDKPFQNWTRSTADLIGAVMLYADYTMPVQPLRDELDRILAGTKLWDGKVKAVQVTDVSEKTIQIRVLVSAADSGIAFDLRCLVRERLLEFMQKNYSGSLPRFRTDPPLTKS